MHIPEFEVRTRNAKRRVLLAVSAVLLLVGGSWGLYEYGRHAGGFDRQAMQALEEGMAALEQENRRLQQRLAHAQQSGRVDQQAHAEVRETLGGLNEEIIRLREELAFYRGIVSPADSRRGLRIHSFDLRPGATGRDWRFQLMLLQAMQHDRQARGRAMIEIVGAMNGSQARFALGDLDERYAGGIEFDFRYYQELGGDILLPEGFEPARVEIALHTPGEESPRAEAEYDWAQEE